MSHRACPRRTISWVEAWVADKVVTHTHSACSSDTSHSPAGAPCKFPVSAPRVAEHALAARKSDPTHPTRGIPAIETAPAAAPSLATVPKHLDRGLDARL